jgi:hypothetical protein
MVTKLEFKTVVHLDLDDPELNDVSVPRDRRLQNNVQNIAEAIEQVIVDEYGMFFVTVSVHFEGESEGR